jgi:hypothetical protein
MIIFLFYLPKFTDLLLKKRNGVSDIILQFVSIAEMLTDSLLVDNIRPVRWNKDAFERLVLPTKIKDMVKSLVMVRAPSRGSKERKVLDMMRDDLIAGKGNGLIMLLHGGPGTGKTLTAGKVISL